VQTYVSTIHLVGPGNLANLNVHLIGHATFDGRLTATVDSWNLDYVQQAASPIPRESPRTGRSTTGAGARPGSASA
jgi:hypothetical protein